MSKRSATSSGGEARTLNSSVPRRRGVRQRERVPALTIVYHPDLGRMGERFLFRPGVECDLELSRTSPEFRVPGASSGRALEERHVSREPLRIRLTAGGTLCLRGSQSRMSVRLNGSLLDDDAELSSGDVERGALLELGGYVLLYLHLAEPSADSGDDLGIVGHSSAIVSLRQEIRRVAPRDVPVLILGESGTGKELVATALHRLSTRSERPLIAVNMAAIQPSTAAAALFGHAKGAFTGAASAGPGYFLSADGGTLFLDEVGDTPASVQPALLRVLGHGEIQPLGVPRPTQVDVRVVAATDADMTQRVADGDFRPQLLMRLGGYELALPALRERREDIGLLLVHFLREFLELEQRTDLLEVRDGERPWLPLWVFAEACLHPWSGNVRELRNAAQRIVISCSDTRVVDSHPAIERLFNRDSAIRHGGSALASAASPGVELSAASTPEAGVGVAAAPVAPVGADVARRVLEDIREAELRAALADSGYRVGRAAKLLGISRTSFYQLCRKYPSIPVASNLSADVIRSALASAQGDVAAAASQLQVSKRALSLRMTTLSLDG